MTFLFSSSWLHVLVVVDAALAAAAPVAPHSRRVGAFLSGGGAVVRCWLRCRRARPCQRALSLSRSLSCVCRKIRPFAPARPPHSQFGRAGRNESAARQREKANERTNQPNWRRRRARRSLANCSILSSLFCYLILTNQHQHPTQLLNRQGWPTLSSIPHLTQPSSYINTTITQTSASNFVSETETKIVSVSASSSLAHPFNRLT